VPPVEDAKDKECNDGHEEEENDDDPILRQAVADMIAGCHPEATEAQKAALRQALDQHHDYLGALLEEWMKNGDVQEKLNAQIVVGYLHIHGGMMGNSTEQIPKNAPPSIHYLLNANQRNKIHRLATTVHDKYSTDFYCRQNWPKLDGFLVHVNEVKPNKSGTEYKDPMKKKRKKTQIVVLAASHAALDRFRAAFKPRIDESSYTYCETTDPRLFADKVHEHEPN
jgi:hypothetical protein